MKRRNFLKKLPLAASIPFALNGIPIRLMAENPITRMASFSQNERVLVILQMHGGNDGLNSLIPVSDYAAYYNKRANIAIPEKKYIPLDSTLPDEMKIGLHPSMTHMKALYDQGKVKFVQGVSYSNNNGSHFRGRDIQFMGGGAEDYFGSGWVGRMLEQQFPNYPDAFPEVESADNPNPMRDPLALEMGMDVSLIFHQTSGFPSSISISPHNLDEALDLDNLAGFTDQQIDPRGWPPEMLNSPYGDELRWILRLEQKTDEYAERLRQLYNQGQATAITYPTTYPFQAPNNIKRNPLSAQLQVVARLLGAGCQTRVFMVKIGGFDTHADQVTPYDSTMGYHAALMYHISSAMKAFQDDLQARGLEDKVLTVTTSEFGRRIGSNGSYGTDHGTGGPMFIFGKGVQPGVLGQSPNLDTRNGNIDMQYDYRVIYANILKDWMQVNDSVINTAFPSSLPVNSADPQGIMNAGTSDGQTFEPLPIAQSVITNVDDFLGARWALKECAPNPAKGKTTMHFHINMASAVTIDLLDVDGRNIRTLISDTYPPGEHKVEVNLQNLPAGKYIYQFKTGFYKEAKKLIILN